MRLGEEVPVKLIFSRSPKYVAILFAALSSSALMFSIATSASSQAVSASRPTSSAYVVALVCPTPRGLVAQDFQTPSTAFKAIEPDCDDLTPSPTPTVTPTATQTPTISKSPTPKPSDTSGPRIILVHPTVDSVVIPKIVISGLKSEEFTYDGKAHTLNFSVSPKDASCAITYAGSSDAPVRVGNYVSSAHCSIGNVIARAIATIKINKATPVVKWSNPLSITSITHLSKRELNATSSIPGKFRYREGAGKALSIGVQELHADFGPTDSHNYNGAVAKTTITVRKAPITSLVLRFSLGSSRLSGAEIKVISAVESSSGATITITGYAQPSTNKIADQQLGLDRARAVQAQLATVVGSAKFKIASKGSQINKACTSVKNKCVVVSFK